MKTAAIALVFWPALGLSAPTASLKINGKSGYVVLKIGDKPEYSWTSTGGQTPSSTIEADSATCDVPTVRALWDIRTLEGSVVGKVQECQRGHTYTLTYKVEDSAGGYAESTVVLHVENDKVKVLPDEDPATKKSVDPVEKIVNLGKVGTGEQDNSQKIAFEINTVGARAKATQGSLDCAEGAMAALEKSVRSKEKFAACRENFATAMALARAGNKAARNSSVSDAIELSADESLLATAQARKTLAGFSRQFGISQNEYMDRMLKSQGNRDELGDMVKTRLPGDSLMKAWGETDVAPLSASQAPALADTKAAGGEADSAASLGSAGETAFERKVRLAREASNLAKLANMTGLEESAHLVDLRDLQGILIETRDQQATRGAADASLDHSLFHRISARYRNREASFLLPRNTSRERWPVSPQIQEPKK